MPKVLGRYHIISELGRGGMGVVYKAVDPKLERFIAIKCLNDELSNDEITVTRFLREARNVAALNHPHIAQIFLADEDEGKPYFVMEFIDGESLADRLGRDGRLLPEQARRIISECAQALKAAHEENIVHRDIKPGNIMIDRRGRSVLTDFGIASIVHPDAEQSSSAFIMGTPGYLPPEVITGKPADHRGDIFALGAVYYEMLVGRRLVPGSGLEDTARTLLAADFPELGDLDETLDQKTFGVLGRMLAPDPAKRYQSYDDLLADLGVAAEAHPVQTALPASGIDEATRVTPAPLSASSRQPARPSSVDPTQTVDPSLAQPPTTQASVAGKSGSRSGLLVFALLVLVGLTASGFAVVKFAPAQIERVASLLGLSSDDPADSGEISVASSQVAAADDGSPIEEPARQDAEAAVDASPEASAGPVRQTADGDGLAADGPLGLVQEARPVERASEGESDRQSERQSMAEVDPASETGEQQSPTTIDAAVAASGDRQLALVERPADPVADSRSDPSAAVSGNRPVPARVAPPPPPIGVLVIGQGDPAITDPMTREIERALGNDGHELIERGFVSGLSALTAGDDIDLGALAEVALASGARYAVIARALPAGQRELNFYGRYDTAFMVQADTVVYDLHTRRRLGSTEVEQIEYTALNATQRARDLIAPRLSAISADLNEPR